MWSRPNPTHNPTNARVAARAARSALDQYGEVTSAHIITDRETGRSRGFGFVEMPDDEQGQKAIDAVNGAEFEGKVLTVNVARPREERPRNDFGGYNRGGYNRRRY